MRLDRLPRVPERDDLTELQRRRALTEDAARTEAVQQRHAHGGRTARENVADLVDASCFAGNAVIAGCSDLIVATQDSSIGMGGPAMIAGGGLGDVDPDDVGPIEMQAPNGVVDVVVAGEAEAVVVAKQLLGYFQGPTDD